MNYQDFQRQIESTSGLTDWMYYEGESESDYFRSARNNGQFEIVYSASEYRYNWTAKRRSDTMQIEKDCFTLKNAIGFVLIGLAIGWTSAIATVQPHPNCLQSSVMERT